MARSDDHVARVIGTLSSGTEAARSRLAASWQRSWLKHGLDPAADAARRAPDADRLRDQREALEHVLAVATPKLDDLYAMIGHCGCGILLTDAQGLVLDARAGAADVDAFHLWGLQPGVDWSEAAQGTNGIGTCLAEKRALTIHRDQHYLAENFLAFFERDWRRVAQLHVDSGWVPADTRVDELETAVRTVCEPIFNKPLSEISFGQVLMRLFEVARRFQMTVQPQLILLQKTLLQIEGLGRQLYPDLDLWKTAQPILREWASDRLSGRNLASQLRRQLPDLSEALRMLPQVLQQAVQQAADGNLRLKVEQPGIEELRAELRASARRRDTTIVGAVTLLGGLVWLAVSFNPWPGIVLSVAGAIVIALARRS